MHSASLYGPNADAEPGGVHATGGRAGRRGAGGLARGVGDRGRRADLVSFLDGHVRALAYFSGVPRRLAYDNLKSAVVQVRHGRERRLNARFLELRSWYVFDSRFCTPGRGNEKGDVENLAKRSERSYLTPPPDVGSLDEFNEHLLEQCRRDLALTGPRPHGDRTRGQLLEEERRCLRALPQSPFESCQ